MNDWQPGLSNNMTNPQLRTPINNFSKYAMILGLLSVATIFTGFLPLIFGSLAIIFAILSRTRTQQLSPSAKLGMLASVGSIIVALAISIMLIYLINTDEAFHDEFNQYFQQVNGITFDEYCYLTKGIFETGGLPPIPEGSSQDFIDYYNKLESYLNGTTTDAILPMDSETGGDP